jgi:glycosyltransferase involved in cell wall biosynthesis
MPNPFKVVAIMCVYNEADVLGYTLKHLYEQGITVHIIDNWSTDGSDQIAQEFPLEGYEKFPSNGPSKYYSWAPLLKRVEVIAKNSNADWITHHDADEIRRSPRKNESLVDGFARIQNTNYNAINFQVYHFMLVDDLYTGDPEKHFKYYTTDHGDCHMRQVKAWRNLGHQVDLSSTGGHFAQFPGINVSPEKFILKHYPLRSIEQSKRKVLVERLPRYDPVELQKQWHCQYQSFKSLSPEDYRTWIHDPNSLTKCK